LLEEALGLPAQGAEARKELRARAVRIRPFVVEPMLQAFLARAIDEALEHEDWLISLATLLAAKPPAEWIDRDYDHFRVQLAVVARRFRSLEVMASATAVPQEGTNVIRVAVARPGAIEQESVVAIRQEEAELIALLRERVMAAVYGAARSVPRDTVVAALALVTERLLADGVGEEMPAPEEQK